MAESAPSSAPPSASLTAEAADLPKLASSRCISAAEGIEAGGGAAPEAEEEAGGPGRLASAPLPLGLRMMQMGSSALPKVPSTFIASHELAVVASTCLGLGLELGLGSGFGFVFGFGLGLG